MDLNVSVCKSSNAGHDFIHMCMQVRKLLDNGVKVGIGVDGTASNDAGHMLMEVQQTMLLQRVAGNGMLKELSACCFCVMYFIHEVL